MYYSLDGATDRAAMPCDSPVPFVYAGRKGHLQMFGQVRPVRSLMMRVGFHGGGRGLLPGGFSLVSLPNRHLPVNPRGWTAFRPSSPPYKLGFMVFISSTKMVPIIDNPATAEAVLRLRDALGGEPVGICAVPNQVQVDKCCTSGQTRDKLRLVHTVMRFLDTLPIMETPVEGVIAEGPRPVLTLNSANCEVCREPLAWPIVVCTGCVTPHHRECWEYTGGCATYACLRRTGSTIGSREQLDEFLALAKPGAVTLNRP